MAAATVGVLLGTGALSGASNATTTATCDGTVLVPIAGVSSVTTSASATVQAFVPVVDALAVSSVVAQVSYADVTGLQRESAVLYEHDVSDVAGAYGLTSVVVDIEYTQA